MKSGQTMARQAFPTLDFVLPPELEASEPPEARGLARDEVRLLVSYREDDHIEHTRFRDIGRFLKAGDLLVINTSGTMNAALPAIRADGTLLGTASLDPSAGRLVECGTAPATKRHNPAVPHSKRR